MTSPERRGFMGRLSTTVSNALQRAILGKSADGYMKQFTGDDEYWERVLGARRGRPGQGSEERGSRPQGGQQRAASGEAPSTTSAARRILETENGPVDKWTEPQRDDPAARKAGDRVAHELIAVLHVHDKSSTGRQPRTAVSPTPPVEKKP
jgi:hypothetical protein